MTNHTPGPWKVENWTYQDGKELKPTITNGQDAVAQITRLYRPELAAPKPNEALEEEIANARLIAAAPELLEALRLMIEWKNPDEARAAVRMAKEALAKATLTGSQATGHE